MEDQKSKPWLALDVDGTLAIQGEYRPHQVVESSVVGDEVDHDLRAWASGRSGTLLVEIDPRVGLQEDQVEHPLKFAAEGV